MVSGGFGRFGEVLVRFFRGFTRPPGPVIGARRSGTESRRFLETDPGSTPGPAAALNSAGRGAYLTPLSLLCLKSANVQNHLIF